MTRRVEQVQRGLLHRLVHHAVLRDPLVVLPRREHEQLAHRLARRAQKFAAVLPPHRVRARPRRGVPIDWQANLEDELAAVVEVPPGQRARG